MAESVPENSEEETGESRRGGEGERRSGCLGGQFAKLKLQKIWAADKSSVSPGISPILLSLNLKKT